MKRIISAFLATAVCTAAMSIVLIKLMQDPQIVYVSGGHLGTVLKAGDYVREIKKFLEGME